MHVLSQYFLPLHWKMPHTCVAINCNNSPSDKISLHKFPGNKYYKKLWIDFVSTKRANWKYKSVDTLCSDHFEKECFPTGCKFKWDIPRSFT